MRRLTTVLAFAIACSFGLSTAYAGPGCCAKKGDKAKQASLAKAECSAKSSCSETFPALVRVVGDKEVQCPMAAEKMAKESNGKIVFVVADQKFQTEPEAIKALADASENFMKRYTSIACVKDGKVMYCSMDGCEKSCGDKAKLTSAEAKSGCCSASKAKLTSAEGKTCPLTGKKIATEGAKTCDKSGKLAEIGGHGSGTNGKLVTDEGKTCPLTGKKIAAEGEETCDKGAKLAKAEGKTCPLTGKTIASEDKLTCDKSGKTAKLVKDDAKETGCNPAECKGATFRVAGRTFDKYDDAVNARAAVLAAVEKVKMSYIVDGKKVDCSSQVCPSAKKAGKVKFVVGDNETACEYDARIKLAKMQYEAAKDVGTKSVAANL